MVPGELVGDRQKLDMGKSCVRFRTLEDVPHEVVGEAIARTSVDGFIAVYERSRGLTAQT